MHCALCNSVIVCMHHWTHAHQQNVHQKQCAEMCTHHWTSVHQCTIGSNVLAKPKLHWNFLHLRGLSGTAVCYESGGFFTGLYNRVIYQQSCWHILFVYMLYLNKMTLLTQSAGSCLWWSLENIIWSSNCHLIAIRWSLFRPVRYHGWIVPQSSDHDAVADVSVVTLVALPANPGNPWKPCFRTSWDRTQILCPPVLDPTSSCSMSKTVKLCPTHFPPQTSASAIILWKYFICGRTLTTHMTNAHPGPQPYTFAPTAVVLWSSLFCLVCDYFCFSADHQLLVPISYNTKLRSTRLSHQPQLWNFILFAQRGRSLLEDRWWWRSLFDRLKIQNELQLESCLIAFLLLMDVGQLQCVECNATQMLLWNILLLNRDAQAGVFFTWGGTRVKIRGAGQKTCKSTVSQTKDFLMCLWLVGVVSK